MTDHDDPSTEPPATYADAVAELDALLASLDDDAIDVDDLARRVARAAELIRWCRSRVAASRFEVEQIVASLPSDDDDDGDP